jgi:putative ABC transport system permease protein
MTTVRDRVAALREASVLIVRRRARRDLGLLLTVVALISVAAMLAIAGPRLVLATVDGGVQRNVASAGARADIQLLTAFSSSDRVLSLITDLPARLPPGLARVQSGLTVTVLSADGAVDAVDGIQRDPSSKLAVQVAMLTPQNEPALRLDAGRLPAERASGDTAVEVVLSQAAADAAGLELGSLFTVGIGTELVDSSKPPVTFALVGIATPKDVDAPEWVDLPELWSPFERPRSEKTEPLTRFTVLAAADGVDAIAETIEGSFTTRVRITVDPEAFTTPVAAEVADELAGLSANSADLVGNSGGGLEVRTELTPILKEYPIQARAALAQMSVMMAGVIGIAGIVVILLTRLLVVHRAGALALERARGASVISIGFRSLIESAVLTAAGLVAGSGLAQLVLPGETRDPGPAVVVALVSLLAGPVQAMILVRAAWTGRREPANRQDRAQLRRRAQVRRAVVELGIIALAVGALVSLRGRGLLQTRTDGIDPFLAVAPLLLAIAITVVVVRVYPVPVRVAAALARRSRGALGILGAVRAQQSIAVLPLLAITLGAALAVSGGLLVDTVRSGQDLASWQRVGADVRINGELDESSIDALATMAGVDLVSASLSRPSVGLDLGTSTQAPTVIAIDHSYADLVDAVPGLASSSSLRELGRPVAEGEPLPIVVDSETARLLISKEIGMYYGPKFVPLVVVGTTEVRPIGYLDGPFAYVDLEALSARMPEPLIARTVLVVGPRAAEAVDTLDLPLDAVLTRADWLQQRRALALVSGVERTMIAAVLAVGLLASIALVATVIGGARARGRALAMLRTLGMKPRLGWWLALAELAPMVIAAVIGGIVAGVVVVAALAPSLGLDLLAGGVTIPEPSISTEVFVSLAIGAFAVLLIGALADVLTHRRDKLSEVLRVGDTV